MCNVKWEEVEPKQNEWKRQINITAYYGEHLIGSIVYYGEALGWQSVIEGQMEFLDAESEDEAKSEMIDRLNYYLDSKINYCEELKEGLVELDQ